MSYFERALELAERGRGKVGDHPLVGAVVVAPDGEVVDDVPATIAAARASGLQVGVAFNPESEPEEVAAVAGDADIVLCMSIHPGYSGQDFLPDALDRIRRLRTVLPEHIYVQVDGGIGNENVRDVRDAGARLLVSGAAIFEREDLSRAYRRLVQALA